MYCKKFENSDKVMILKNGQQSDACEVGFQPMTDIFSAAIERKGEGEGGVDEREGRATVRRSLNGS
jgi:hypothetical protein